MGERIDALRDLAAFVRERRKYALLPLIIILLAMAVFIVLAEIPAIAPFIYAIF